MDTLDSTTIKGRTGDRKLVDLDETILVNEQYLRSKKLASYGNYLVTLDDLCKLFGPPTDDEFIQLRRKTPPKGGFEFLNEERHRFVRILSSDSSFIRSFDYVTKGSLKGLNWDRAFVQGEIVLHALLHTDSGSIADYGIDLYLYDMTPEEANCKVEEIYNIWSANLGTDSEHAVIKNAKTINFVPKHPHPQVHIILKLLHSPMDSLFRVGLDPYAICFDGSRVFMLPRCARALETGYSVFTMDLIWGYRLGNRRGIQEERVFRCAEQGFGFRILPSYCRSLGQHDTDDMALPDKQSALVEMDEVHSGPTRGFNGEPGLKTIRRLARLAYDCIRIHWLQRGHRFYQGILRSQSGIGVFELLMRHCAMWASEKREDRTYMRDLRWQQHDPLTAIISDGLAYSYGHIDLGQLERNVADRNNQLFLGLRRAIAEKLNIGPGQGRYVDYLTRRIRQQVVAPDLESVQAKQITAPLVIPLDLEVHISNELASRYDDIPGNRLSRLLIPVHDPSKHDTSTATLPSLHDTANESGNIRYWLITNTSMWTAQHRVLDEVAELLMALLDWFLWYTDDAEDDESVLCDRDDAQCMWRLANIFRRRLVHPDFSKTLDRGRVLPEQEARLFRAWVLAPAPTSEIDNDTDIQELMDMIAEQGGIEDQRFWKDGDEGTWDDEEGVPVWED
ncbi:MAG: hypothetical protein Q9170_006714 [Blastenia crenularia]